MMKRITLVYLFVYTLVSVIRCDHLENVESDAASRNKWKPIIENNVKTSDKLGNTNSDEHKKDVSKASTDKPLAVANDRIKISESPLALGLQSDDDYIELQESNHPQNTRQKVPTTEKVTEIGDEHDSSLKDRTISPKSFMNELRSITKSMLDVESEIEHDNVNVEENGNNNIVPAKRSENILKARENLRNNNQDSRADSRNSERLDNSNKPSSEIANDPHSSSHSSMPITELSHEQPLESNEFGMNNALSDVNTEHTEKVSHSNDKLNFNRNVGQETSGEIANAMFNNEDTTFNANMNDNDNQLPNTAKENHSVRIQNNDNDFVSNVNNNIANERNFVKGTRKLLNKNVDQEIPLIAQIRTNTQSPFQTAMTNDKRAANDVAEGDFNEHDNIQGRNIDRQYANDIYRGDMDNVAANRMYPDTKGSVATDISDNPERDTSITNRGGFGNADNNEIYTGENPMNAPVGRNTNYVKPVYDGQTDVNQEWMFGNGNLINNGDNSGAITDRRIPREPNQLTEENLSTPFDSEQNNEWDTSRQSTITSNRDRNFNENSRIESQYYPAIVEGRDQYVKDNSRWYLGNQNTVNNRPVNVQRENEFARDSFENNISNSPATKNNEGLYSDLYPGGNTANSNIYPSTQSNDDGNIPPVGNGQFVNQNYDPAPRNFGNEVNYPRQKDVNEQTLGSNRQYPNYVGTNNWAQLQGQQTHENLVNNANPLSGQQSLGNDWINTQAQQIQENYGNTLPQVPLQQRSNNFNQNNITKTSTQQNSEIYNGNYMYQNQGQQRQQSQNGNNEAEFPSQAIPSYLNSNNIPQNANSQAQTPTLYQETSNGNRAPETMQQQYPSVPNGNRAPETWQQQYPSILNGNRAPETLQQQYPSISSANRVTESLQQQYRGVTNDNGAPESLQQQYPRTFDGNRAPETLQQQYPSISNSNRAPETLQQQYPGMTNGNRAPETLQQQYPSISNSNRAPETLQQQYPSISNGNRTPETLQQQYPSISNGNPAPETLQQQYPSISNGNRVSETIQQQYQGISNGNRATETLQQQYPSISNSNRVPETLQQQYPSISNGNRAPETLQQQYPIISNGNRAPETIQQQYPIISNGNRAPETMQQQYPSISNSNREMETLRQQYPSISNSNRAPETLQQQYPSISDSNRAPETLQQQYPGMTNGNRAPETLQQQYPGMSNGNRSPETLQQQYPGFSNGNRAPETLQQQQDPGISNGNRAPETLQQQYPGISNGNRAPETLQQQYPGISNGNRAPETLQQQYPGISNGNRASETLQQQYPGISNGNRAPETLQQQYLGISNGNRAPETLQQQYPGISNGNRAPETLQQQYPGISNGNRAPETLQQQYQGISNGNRAPETLQQQYPGIPNGEGTQGPFQQLPYNPNSNRAQGNYPQQNTENFNDNNAPQYEQQEIPGNYNGNRPVPTAQPQMNANNRAQLPVQRGTEGQSNENSGGTIQGPTDVPYNDKNTPYSVLDAQPPPYYYEEEGWADNIDQATTTTTTTSLPPRQKDDIPPLNIFTNEISYQRFPKPMSVKLLKEKILGKPQKKLYILEESETKLFTRVRQVSAIYTMEDNMLYVSLLYRNVFSRECKQIKKFAMGKLIGNTDKAMFEKEVKDGKTERVLFFTDHPSDYVYFMSCTDMNTSPYACRDSYYVTLDTPHDPPNQFPWEKASRELRTKMRLSFNDPRFIFNFVLLPCKWGPLS